MADPKSAALPLGYAPIRLLQRDRALGKYTTASRRDLMAERPHSTAASAETARRIRGPWTTRERCREPVAAYTGRLQLPDLTACRARPGSC